jgi:aerobic-type carbon monoxide dehydrogenase small subunit (CoxS/CutS family)
MTRLKLTVNEQVHDLDVDPDTPLLWVLRDTLGLMGTKFGCGVGTCGACTVHLNEQTARSCQLPVRAVAGRHVTTIEGLKGTEARRLRDAWLTEDVAQCGYCQTGQLMSAAGLLKRIANPSDAEIDAAMAGNICRCGTYQRIRRAIHRAARQP